LEDVSSGGVASNATITGPAVLSVGPGGLAVAPLVSANTGSGGLVVAVSGTASGAVVSSGGGVSVQAGGVESAGAINAGGVASVAGETAGDTVLGAGVGSAALEVVTSGGVAFNTLVQDTGQLVVLSGGTAVGASLFFNDSGGPAVNGGLIVSSGGLASASMVQSGGIETVRSGGTLSGATLSNGGLLAVDSGGIIGAGAVTFASGGGTLRLGNAGDFAAGASIAGFASGSLIDLADVVFASATISGYVGNNTSGTLTVGDGIHTARLALLGQYTAASFQLTSEGNGGTGTIVTSAQLMADAAMVLQATHS
jgi:autotransporter passenger strand-loop-strand repeat protein